MSLTRNILTFVPLLVVFFAFYSAFNECQPHHECQSILPAIGSSVLNQVPLGSAVIAAPISV